MGIYIWKFFEMYMYMYINVNIDILYINIL